MPKTMKTSSSEMAIMAEEDASISGAQTSSKKWKKPMIFGFGFDSNNCILIGIDKLKVEF